MYIVFLFHPFILETVMLAIALWAARFFLFFMIVRLVVSLFFKKGPAFPKKPKEEIKRFKADNGTVVDADFKEL
jgi:hypothetical protein